MLSRKGYHIATIHGGMDLADRIEAERRLWSGSVDILIATDAASEGVNLQAANILINYDLPWNPSRLDQRIGRIHRYGQKKKVFIYNVLIPGTIDERVFTVLKEKLDKIRAQLGKVYDYLGAAISFGEFKKLVMKAIQEAAARTSREHGLEELAESIPSRRAKTLGEIESLLISNRISLGAFDPRCRPEDEVSEDELEGFTISLLTKIDTTLSHIEKIPGTKHGYKIRLPSYIAHAYSEGRTQAIGSFNKEEAKKLGIDYFGLNHPVIRALVNYASSSMAKAYSLLEWLTGFFVFSWLVPDGLFALGSPSPEAWWRTTRVEGLCLVGVDVWFVVCSFRVDSFFGEDVGLKEESSLDIEFS